MSYPENRFFVTGFVHKPFNILDLPILIFIPIYSIKTCFFKEYVNNKCNYCNNK